MNHFAGFFVRLRRMLRIYRLVMFLDEFLRTRSLEDRQPEFHRALRQGLLESDVRLFISFLQTKRQFAGEDHDYLSNFIDDARVEEFLAHQQWSVAGPTVKILGLGRHGRKLTRGSWLVRKMYLIEYLYGEHKGIYSLLFGGGIVLVALKAFPYIRDVARSLFGNI